MILDTIESTKPHCESQMPYGYRFANIDLYKVDNDWNTHCELKNDHQVHAIDVRFHAERMIFEVASFIEGNFGVPYKAILIHSGASLTIYTPKNDEWWNMERWRSLTSYLMGLRSLTDILKD